VSRIGLAPISIPKGVKVNVDGNTITVEGAKGKLTRSFDSCISVTLKDDTLVVGRTTDDRDQRSLHGLTRTLISNMVEGVTKSFVKTLELSGVGYRAQKNDKGITLQIGFCHTVDFASPEGINLTVEGNNKILVSGIDKEEVGQVAAKIRALRPPDSYKGKGIIYQGEKVRRKPGKAGKTALKK
jgi:large subunit ribosomal protein L6